MLSEIIQQRKITNKAITCTQSKITSIGRSPLYQNIQCLYLTGNKLRSLAGIEQFIFLKTLQVSNNLIDSINEIYRVFNPSILQILGCADNPFSENPCHITLIFQKFIGLQQIDDIKLSFDRRQYFNWIEECEKLIIPAFYTIINQKVSAEIFQISIQLKQLLKKYDPSIEALNQLFHLMLIKIIQSIDEIDEVSDEIQQSLLWEILGYQEKNKHKKLKKFLIVQSLEDQSNDLFLFAQNEEYACEAITKAFINLSQNQDPSSFSYFPLNKAFMFALVEVFLKQIKYDQPKKVSIPEMTIARKDLSKLLSKPNESTMEKTQTKVNFQESYDLNFGRSDEKYPQKSLTQEKSISQDQFFQDQSFHRNQSFNMNHERSNKQQQQISGSKSIPVEDRCEYFQQQIQKSRKEILNIRLAKHHKVMNNLDFIETRVQQQNREALQKLFLFASIKQKFLQKLIKLTQILEQSLQVQAQKTKKYIFNSLIRQDRYTVASDRLEEFLTFALKIDKRNILYSLQDEADTFPPQREQYLKREILLNLKRRAILRRILKRQDLVMDNKKLNAILRWKIISNNLKYAEQRVIGLALRSTKGLDSTSTLPKQRVIGDPDLLRNPLTLRDDRFIGPITIENATIICKNTDKKKKKKKKKRMTTESSKSKSTSHSHICSRKQFYCDICQTLMSKLV